MIPRTARRWLTNLGVFTAHPAALGILVLYAVCWAVFKPDTFDWQAGATLATWFMTLVIQRAEYRDTQAMHAKLDELLRAHGEARNELMHIDQKDAEEVARQRDRLNKGEA